MFEGVTLDGVSGGRACGSTEPQPNREVRRAARKTGHSVTIDDIRIGPPTLDVATAGRLLGISRSYAFELARRDEFPCRLLKVGSRYRVPRSALVELLE